VLRLETQGRHVESVLCERDGQILKLRGRLVILAAGALATPALLLRSESRQWPQGLANGSGMVGRHLMRHCIDLYALAPPIKPTVDENVKELAFNDFYLRDGKKLGTVQSFGRLPPAPMLAASLQEDIRTAAGRTVASLFGLAKPLMRPLLAKTFDNALILASTLEDLPFGDNRVFPVGADGIGINYRLNAKDRARIAAFRSLMADTLQPWKYRLLKQAENNERIAHACGTCRMGTDPANSVVDRDNRAHDLDNLFIVDSAFFPSSGGTNPSLTIAANALRVAERILSGGYLR
jgi:choline dehydrogenase-like flavoprotein